MLKYGCAKEKKEKIGALQLVGGELDEHIGGKKQA